MNVASWASTIRSKWETVFPRCREADCGSRKMWRRLYWRRAGIHLENSWYCGPQCFEHAVCRSLTRAQSASPSKTQPVRHRIPLGLLMLSRGQLTNRQLRMALDAQRTSGTGRIGHWLEQLGFATEQQITAALGVQWACPVFPISTARDNCEGLLPLPLLEAFRMLPVQFVPATRLLYVAFCESIEYTALYAIEQMLRCRTEACLVGDSAMTDALGLLAESRRPADILFDGCRDAAEMARITCGYALKLGASEVRIACCGEFIWARLECSREPANLLFHRRDTAPQGDTLHLTGCRGSSRPVAS